MITRPIISILVLAFLLLPFFILFGHIGNWSFGFSTEVFDVLLFTFWQAFLSALFSVLAGSIGACGLLYLSSSKSGLLKRTIEPLILLPNMLPVLLTILAVMNIFTFSRGLAGIVFVHVLLNSGLVAVAIGRFVREKIGGMAELAWIEGASRWHFFWHGFVRYLKHDLFLVFLFVFAICFASFAVPLVVGGSRATTLEVLIFEKIRLSGNWAEALGLAALETLVIFMFSLFLGRQVASRAYRPLPVRLLEWRWGIVVVLVPVLILVYGLLRDLPRGWQLFSGMAMLSAQIPPLVWGSAAVAIGTGLLTLVCLLLISLIRPEGIFRKILISYVAPSSVLTGFALLIFWRAVGVASFIKIIVGLTLITVPAFYRLRWDGLIRSLESQSIIARTLGAGDWMTFRRVILPQVWRSACFFGGVASFWAWGDFALSAVIAERPLTLALVIHGLMGSYRLEVATFLVWILIFGGSLTFLGFWGAGHVFGAKSQT